MGADGTLLQLMWLASPALPVGGFSYSEGLESAVEAGLVGNEAQAAGWLAAQLHTCAARADLPAVAHAMAAWAAEQRQDAAEINDWVRCTRETSELRLQAEQMGRSLAGWLQNGPCGGDERVAVLAALDPAPTWPVAYALALTLAGASPREGLLACAFGWAENMTQAAIKAVPLGQAAAQRVLARLAQEIPAAVDAALAVPADGRIAFAPMLAILSSRHEVQYSRLFRS